MGKVVSIRRARHYKNKKDRKQNEDLITKRQVRPQTN